MTLFRDVPQGLEITCECGCVIVREEEYPPVAGAFYFQNVRPCLGGPPYQRGINRCWARLRSFAYGARPALAGAHQTPWDPLAAALSESFEIHWHQ